MSVRSRLRRTVEGGLSAIEHRAPVAAAYGDWIDPRRHGSWGGPMNGQPGRRTLTRALASVAEPRAVIETGTFRGTTTQFLWDVCGCPVWTVEASPRNAAFARWRFLQATEVTVCVGDSRAWLRRLGDDSHVPKGDVLFYLDAHWGAELPLREELTAVLARWRDPIVMVDDFAVPGDPGYGFDDYGPDRRLELSYLPSELMDGFVPLFPVLRSSDEAGLRRGCVVIVSRSRADRLLAAGVPLRRADADDTARSRA